MSARLHDPGGKVRLRLRDGMTGTAVFSRCGRYRPLLTRDWPGLLPGPPVLFVGMNPSTAEADVDDSTIRREIGFAQREGAGGYVKVNVMDFRATQPGKLLHLDVPPASRDNLPTIREQARRVARAGGFAVAAWGSLHPSLRGYAAQAREVLMESGIRLTCLGFNADGSPKHPLYLASDTPFVPFPMPELPHVA